jgi:dolichol kinase
LPASLLTITFESIYPEKLASYLDDNIAMPLLAGAIMMVMS